MGELTDDQLKQIVARCLQVLLIETYFCARIM